MKKYAEVIDGIITNIIAIDDQYDMPKNHIDVTDKICDMGYPVVDNEPVLPPSQFHELDGLKWVISTKRQKEKDDFDSKKERMLEIQEEKNNVNLNDLTLQEANDFIDEQFKNVTTIKETVSVTKDTLKKMILYILK